MRATTSMILGLLLVFVLEGCGGRGNDVLRLDVFLQEGRPDVRLNERLVLRFSRPLDRTSLSEASVTLRGPSGPARGRWKVLGRELRFLPRLPLALDGSDCGFRSGEKYTLILRGFPDFRALRAVTGEYLEQTLRLSFQTAGREGGSGPLSLDLFVDPVPGRGPEVTAVDGRPVTAVGTEGVKVIAGSTLRLAFSEPLYPGSLRSGSAKVYVLNAEGTVDPALDALPLDARLLHEPPEGCVVALEPEGGFLGGKRYKLCLEDLGFTDFGGRPVEKTRSYLDITCVLPPPP